MEAGKCVTIIIVTFNSEQVIEDCLRSIPENMDVCIVDNASADSTIRLAKSVRPAVKIILSPENLGFAKAMNLGIGQAETEFVLLLNPDARLADNTVYALVARAHDYPDAAIISPVLYHPSGEQQSSYRSNVFTREKTSTKYIEPDGDLCVEMVSGAVMLWRMSDMQTIGFFDDSFFFTYEDDDLCMRVRLAGKSIVVVPEATVVHDSGTSTPPSAALTIKKTRYVMASRLYFEQKYNGLSAARKMALSQAVKYFLRTVLYLPFMYKKGILRSYGRSNAAYRFLRESFR